MVKVNLTFVERFCYLFSGKWPCFLDYSSLATELSENLPFRKLKILKKKQTPWESIFFSEIYLKRTAGNE